MNKKIKNIGFFTNPLVYIAGIPFVLGIVLSAMTYGTFKNTKKIVSRL